MNIINTLAYVRASQLRKNLKQIEKKLSGYSERHLRKVAVVMLSEYSEASKLKQPYLYQSTTEDMRYRPWGDGTDIAWERIQSDNVEIQLRGIGLWLAISYHETRDTEFKAIHDVHRKLIRIARTFKELTGASSENVGSFSAAVA